MKSFQKPWYIAGGWAIDIELGEVTRKHKDLDICIFREDAAYALNYFQDWDIHVTIPGENRLEPCKNIEDLKLPRYGLHLYKDNEFLELLLTDRAEEEIVFRKNNEVRMKMKEFGKGSATRPYVNPAWQLLFKSLSTRKEDEHDFKIYRDRIQDKSSMKWLRDSMITTNGNKEWIEELTKQLEDGGDIL